MRVRVVLYLKKKTTKLKNGDIAVYWYAQDAHTGKYYNLELPPNTAKQTAQRTCRSYAAFLNQTGTLDNRHGDLSVLKYAEKFLYEIEQTIRPNTYRSYKLWLARFGMFCASIGRHRTETVRTDDVIHFRTILSNELSPNSVNIALRSLRVMFRYALRNGAIRNDPTAGVKMVHVPKHTMPAHWTPEQYERFMSSVSNDRLRAGFALGFYAGLRLREATHLKWADVTDGNRDAAENYILVRSTDEFETKSGKSREVPLFPALSAELARLHRTSEYVLSITSNPGNPWYFSKMFTRMVRTANKGGAALPVITFHGLRHSFAAMLATRVQLPVLKELLGHADVTTTMIYASLQPSAARMNAARAMLTGE